MLAPLKKGIEVEVFTGTRQGDAVGLSPRIVPALQSDDFVYESDARHVEYVTPPLTSYDDLLGAIIRPRLALRRFLEAEGGYTVFPGSTLALPFDQAFHPSRPQNAYYQWVGATFGTDILTSSVHISLGLDDPDEIVAISNWLRLDMPLFLALAASSPYRNGVDSGHHSSRWITFPQEPVDLCFFDDHAHFVRFVEEALAAGKMRSVRHMWSAVRPNGPDRPYELNRIEVRICDLVFDPALLLAITALLEARVQQLRLKTGKPAEGMMAIARENERRVAKSSLNASVLHYGKETPVRQAITRLMSEVEGLMLAMGTAHHLATIQRVLDTGNEAMRFLDRVQALGDVRLAVIEAIDEAEAIDRRYERLLAEKEGALF